MRLRFLALYALAMLAVTALRAPEMFEPIADAWAARASTSQ